MSLSFLLYYKLNRLFAVLFDVMNVTARRTLLQSIRVNVKTLQLLLRSAHNIYFI